jgi:hypothetical protein
MQELRAATEAYQALLEGHRRDPDDELLWDDLQKARAAMEIAWLEAAVNGPQPRVTRERAIAAATSAGRQAGYAVTVHSTHRREVDLIAVPWTDGAVPPGELVRRITDALPGAVQGGWTLQPHGRRVWAIAVDRWSINLSVLPRRRT